MPTIKCHLCGKAAHKTPSDVAKTKRQFCSRKCFAEWLSATRKGVPRPELTGPKPHLRKRVTLTCPTCGKQFEVKESHAERRRYCSKACADAPGQVEAKCEVCGKIFTGKKSVSEQGKNRFCSKTCHAQYQRTLTGPLSLRWDRVKVSCEHCGKTLEIVPHRLKAADKHFCNADCYSSYQYIGPEIYYGPDWQRQRRKARKRDNYTCRKCGISEKACGRELDVHHIISFRHFGTERHKEANKLSNLISLCKRCHSLAEHNGL